jgi:hypothetical protein
MLSAEQRTSRRNPGLVQNAMKLNLRALLLLVS